MSENNLPVSIVIFGASGDLNHRKLIPALFNSCRKERLPDFNIIGFASNDWNDETFRSEMKKGVEQFAEYEYAQQEWEGFEKSLFYAKGDFTKPEDFQRLKKMLESHEKGPTGRLYYLATPPAFFTVIVQQLSDAGMTQETDAWRRVVIEKPFGSDLASAQSLNKTLHRVLDEDQIYRIDHYLGKETVQNILVFRFANIMFEPVWNRKYIDHVQITVSETVGVGHRAGYYEKAGVLRDMFQNHLLQLLSLVALEPPNTLKNRDLHDRKLEVLRAIRDIQPEEVKSATVRGQYKGYRSEPGVAPDSQTPTFAAIRLFIDNPRWEGVPFYLRSGKMMTDKVTDIVVRFNCPPYNMYPMPPGPELTPNILSFCIQPDEGVYLRFEAKVPDTAGDTRSVEMDFHYASSFGPTAIPEAYERLLLDALNGDQTLFTRDREAEEGWKLIDPIIAGWQSPDAPPLEIYEPGSWGPEGAERLINHRSRQWHIACGKQQDI